MMPERAIPAAARYLAGMEQKFGGRDWAIFAYHCGQGCVGEMQEMTRRARGIPKDKLTRAAHVLLEQPGVESRAVRGHPAADAARLVADLLVPHHARASSCWRSTGATRTRSLALAQEYRSEFVTGRARAAPPVASG